MAVAEVSNLYFTVFFHNEILHSNFFTFLPSYEYH